MDLTVRAGSSISDRSRTGRPCSARSPRHSESPSEPVQTMSRGSPPSAPRGYSSSIPASTSSRRPLMSSPHCSTPAPGFASLPRAAGHWRSPANSCARSLPLDFQTPSPYEDADSRSCKPRGPALPRTGAERAPDFALTGDNAALVAAICRALDGLPLSLELAAARLDVLTPAQLHRRLDDRFALLNTGSRAAAARQQTLRAALDWSYELLTGEERQMFQRLAAATGPVQDRPGLLLVDGVVTDPVELPALARPSVDADQTRRGTVRGARHPPGLRPRALEQSRHRMKL